MSLADRILGAGPSRPGGPASRPSKGGQSGGPSATGGGRSSPRNQQRPAPYARNSSSGSYSSNTAAGKGSVEDKWEHDLFNPLSDMMQPQLNTSFGKAQRTTSGAGVFGKALSGITSSSSSRNATRSPPVSATASSNQDLFSRFNVTDSKSLVNGTSGSGFRSASEGEGASNARLESLRQKAKFEAQAREREEERRLSKQRDAERLQRERDEERRREELLRQEALDIQMARQQEEELEQQRTSRSSQSTLVLIQNLVDGTTPEDVKAALGDFGEILDCRVRQSDGDTVSMELDFTNRADAQKAVQQLDGALADGKTLRLSIQEKPKPMGMPLKGAKNRQEHAQQKQQQQNQQQRKPVAAFSPTTEASTDVSTSNASKLRSDRVATYDERAYILDRPQAQQVARNSGRPQQPPQQQQSRNEGAPSKTSDLLQRFGAPASSSSTQSQTQNRAPRGRGQGQVHNRRGGGHLASRLNGAASGGDVDMDMS